MNRSRLTIITIVMLLSHALLLFSQRSSLRMAEIYSDSMILQRNMPLMIHGKASPNTSVSITIDGRTYHGKSDSAGDWIVRMKKHKAGGPYIMTVASDDDRLTFHDVLFGEVWLCSGQSNMAFMFRQCQEFLEGMPSLGTLGEGSAQQSKYTDISPIRLFNPRPVQQTDDTEWDQATIESVSQKHYLSHTHWTSDVPSSLADFSAVAYFFGRMLRDSLEVPVGLINNSVGGTTTESWISHRQLSEHIPEILTDWIHNPLIQDWCRGRAMRNLGLAVRRGDTDLYHPYQPSYMFEAGILTLDCFPIKGVIWYQGESNAHDTSTHARLFPLLVNDWRRYWQSPDMPFLFVQLSSLNRPTWPEFRDSQRLLAESISNTGMAVVSDVGDSTDVHPKRKQPVGERLARIALADIYHLHFFSRHPSAKCGPVICKATTTNDGDIRLNFKNDEGLKTANDGKLLTFEVAESDMVFHQADATIIDNCVIVNATVPHPAYLRYGWQPFTRANLVNCYNLPTSTFMIEIQ